MPLSPRYRIDRHATIDDDVRLGEKPGRTLGKFQPLILGKHARIRSGSVLYAFSHIGSYFETGHHVVVREQNVIGDHVCLWNNTTIDYGCRIGNGVKIHTNVYIAQYSILEDDVFIAPGVVFANDLFPGHPQSAKVLQGPVLKKGAQIGVNATLLPGIVIGEGSLIGAGSVVTHSIPAGSVAWGNPAKVYKNKHELTWPSDLLMRRPEARALYRKLTGKRVFS